MNTKRAIVLPIYLSIAVVIGIVIGIYLKPTYQSYPMQSDNAANKFNAVLNYVDKEYVDTIDKSALVENAIPLILKELDPHSIYIPAKDLAQVNESLDGNFEGIGVQFNIHNDTILVVTTISGGPSEKIGLMAGDRIVTVNDSVIAGVGINNTNVIKLLKGPRGTKVNVGILRRGESDLLNFEITRDKIPLYSLDTYYMIKDDIGYFKLSKFSKTTFQEFNSAVADLKSKGMHKIILDLRGNSGGFLNEAISVVDEFLKKNTLIVYTQGKSHPRHNNLSTERGFCKNDKVVVLVDEWSASASEIVSGAIQDNDRGLVIGRRSFGKGLVQEQTMFPDGSALRLTISRYYTPTGRCIQKPYNKGEEDYMNDIGNRMMHGEMSNKDSIHFDDTVKYITPKGKILYGGGGIMPDIFVPVDTVGVSDYFIKIRNQGLIYRFALNYTDKYRKKLDTYNNYKKLDTYLQKQNLLDLFIEFAKTKNIEPVQKEINISKEIMNVQLRAYIVRDIFNDKGFYPIIHKIDKTLNVAVETISNEK